jgi:hypothetical protein
MGEARYQLPPVGGGYASCVKTFGKQYVKLEDETNTTKKSWETRRTKELVFKTVSTVCGTVAPYTSKPILYGV